MFRVLLVVCVVLVGAGIGSLIALISLAAFLEFGNSGCASPGCTQPLLRTLLGAGVLMGGLLGLGKGINMISTPKLVK